MSQAAAEAEDQMQAEAEKAKGKDPKAGLIAALEAERRKRHEAELRAAKLEGRTEGLQRDAEPPKEYTRAQLRELVEAGKLKEEEADEIMDRQLEARIMAKAEETLRTTSETTTRAQRVASEIDRYAVALPAVLEEGSVEREKVAREYQYLIEHGHPEDKTTELAALRAAFGPVSNLRKYEETRETHMEADGGGGRDDASGGDGAPKNMDAETKRYYADLIGKGLYKDWAQVREEYSKYGKKRARR